MNPTVTNAVQDYFIGRRKVHNKVDWNETV